MGTPDTSRDSRPLPLARTVRVIAITDRRLMVPAAVLATGDWSAIARGFGAAISRAVAGCPAGTIIVPVREKDLDGGPLLHRRRRHRRHPRRLDRRLARIAHRRRRRRPRTPFIRLQQPRLTPPPLAPFACLG